MKPINFKEATKVLQRPSTMTDAECASLHVWSDGNQCVSCWKPSVWERVKILFGGKVYLGVKGGGTQPPVFVTGENPFNRLSVTASIIAYLGVVVHYIATAIKMVWNNINDEKKRTNFMCGFIMSIVLGMWFHPAVGFLAGTLTAAFQEWWENKGHGKIEFLDFFFSVIGAAFAIPFVLLLNFLFM